MLLSVYHNGPAPGDAATLKIAPDSAILKRIWQTPGLTETGLTAHKDACAGRARDPEVYLRLDTGILPSSLKKVVEA
jgi:hypothetical protein